MCEPFIDYFEKNLISPQIASGAYPLGQYRIKGEADHFFWIRGFTDMTSRGNFLRTFYGGPEWKKHKGLVNPMLANNDNVHLLKPYNVQVSQDILQAGKHLAIIDYYISNTRLPELLEIFTTSYLPLRKNAGLPDCTLWISELAENDFPALPVFQDKNLLVTITFYKDEQEYQQGQQQLNETIKGPLRSQLRDVITLQHTLVLYPTNNITEK